MAAPFDLRRHTILLTIAGSRAFGVHRLNSDVDIKGVAIPTGADFHGFATPFEQATDPLEMRCFLDVLTATEQAVAAASKLEGTVFDLRKFLRLALDANPNLMDVLFARNEEIRVITPLGKRLRECRDLFLSARVRHTFGSYATAQLKRIETHRRWLLSPPSHRPSRAEFGLAELPILPADQLGAATAAIRARVEA